jgi:hypothetical protein
MGFVLFNAQWHLHSFWLSQIYKKIHAGVPNVFDVVSSNQVDPIVVSRAFCCPIVDNDGLVDIEVVGHDTCCRCVIEFRTIA